MKEILDIIHNTIYQFFDVCGDDEEAPMSDKDKLLLEVNKAICNNLKALPPVQLPQNIIRCKDCRFYTNFQKGKPWNVSKKYCNRVVTIKTSPDDFCSFAKAKIIDKYKTESKT